MDFHCGFAKEIIFTRNATEAINLVARTWGAANISLLGAWIFLFAPEQNGEEKKTWKIWDWAKVWWWDSADRYGQGGPTIWMFQQLKFWILECFDHHFNQFCLKGISACYKSICGIFDWPGTSFESGAMATVSRVKWSQAEIWTVAEQWHPGALDFKSVFATVHEKNDTWQPKDIEHFESLINERMVRGLRECFLKQWNTETVAVCSSSIFHHLVFQNPQISASEIDFWLNQFRWIYVNFGSSQTGRSWWDFVTSPMYWAVLILSNVSPRSAIPSTQSWWWMPVKVCCCHVFGRIWCKGCGDLRCQWMSNRALTRKQDCMIWPLIGLRPNSLEAKIQCKFHCSFQHCLVQFGVELTCHRCLTCQLMFRAWEQTG